MIIGGVKVDKKSGMKIGDIFISSLKLMNDTIGGSRPTIDKLDEYLEDSDYEDRLYQMTDAINRGLQIAGASVYLPYDLVPKKGTLTTDGPIVSIPSDKMSYITPIEDVGISVSIALAIPYYVKYELYQDDSTQQAYGAREEFERLLISAKALDNANRQSNVENVFGEVT